MQMIDEWGAKHFDGYAVRNWLAENVDIAVYIAAAYLTFVFKGPDVVAALRGKASSGKPVTTTATAASNGSANGSAKPASATQEGQARSAGPAKLPLLKKIWVVWNLILSVFSLWGTSRVTPALLSDLRTDGFHDTACRFREDQFYTTAVGFAMGAFAISKLPEFGDTVFLILGGKRKLPFLQWFHHVTTFLFAWMAYQGGSSIFIFAAAMNYTVHTIMYFYFAMAEMGYKRLVKPFAMYITLMQITQMVMGLYVSGYVLYQKYLSDQQGIAEGEPGSCSGTSLANVRTQFIIYVCNFYLFSEMFVKGYILPRKAPASASPAAAAAKKTE